MMMMEERLQNLELENAEALQRLEEIKERYERLEFAILEKDEQIQQNCTALQSAAEENSKLKEKNRELEDGRRLAISLVEETQQIAAISETWASKKVEKALQDKEAALQKVAMINQNLAVNARDVAERRAGDAEQARKEAEKRAEQAVQAKILAEGRAKGLESNETFMISSRKQAETRAEKAEADLAAAAAVEREDEARRQLKVATSIDRVEAVVCVKPPKKRPTNPNKGSWPSSSTAKKRKEFRGLEAACHDERLTDLAQDLNRVVKDWGTDKERYALFTFTTDSITVTRVEKGRGTSESSLRVRCVRHGGEAVLTVFSVVSLACTIYGADLDSKAAEELLRAYISQTVSRRHAQNLDVGEETERVTLFR
ncbi:unnamed protein product [Clonostachys solani]|uniref:Uncharacterized protein n=1 Tax=Clonostachys solani TaxID=160281 RepID=A0A9N9ZI03_9HYPO|nr:unnamed protein product [Clonostachys solani]